MTSGSNRVFSWSFSKSPNTKNHAKAITTYSTGIGDKPGIPTTEINEEITMSAIIANRRGLLGFDFQKLPRSRTTKIVNNPPNNSISNEKVLSIAVLDNPR